MNVEAGQIWKDEEVIKEELTLSKRNFVGVVPEMDEEDE